MGTTATFERPPALPTVLLCGFDAFGGSALNPSGMAVQALDGQVVAGHRIHGVQLPTVFGLSLDVLREALARFRPALVVCCGQAGGRAAVSLERVAINVDDARIADNAGAQPVDTPVVAGGPAAYFSTLPIKAMLQALQAEQLPVEVSQTAGTFVCNHVFYGLMHELAQPGHEGLRGGLIHLPWLAGQGEPSLPLERIVHALNVAIACTLTTPLDIRRGAGSLN
jgi:pyroglutamyl-peptidase